MERAAGDGEMMGQVGELYAEVDRLIGELEVGCEGCGQCCRFEEFGQELLVSTAEVGYLLACLRRRSPLVVRKIIENAGSAGQVCPFLEGESCGMREGRALGCRVFFCQTKGAQRTRMEEIYELYHKRISDLHARRRLSYEYLPWSKAMEAVGELLESDGARAESTYSGEREGKGL